MKRTDKIVDIQISSVGRGTLDLVIKLRDAGYITHTVKEAVFDQWQRYEPQLDETATENERLAEKYAEAANLFNISLH